MRADLHTHSIYSDGYYTPDELCRRAKENGVELLSVTDHDTLNGEEEKRAAAEKYGLRYVSGWEISAYSGESKIHITGYNCKRNAAYEKFMRERVELGFERAEDSIRNCAARGFILLSTTRKPVGRIPLPPSIPCISLRPPQRFREKLRGRFTRNTSRREKSLIPLSDGPRPKRRRIAYTLRAASRP